MKETLLFKAKDIKLESFGGPPGTARIARLIGPDESATMGGGIAEFDGCSIEWTVLYDEAVVVLEGKFRLRVGKDYARVIEGSPGDVIWIPEGTPLKYEGEKSRIFYTLYPVDWKTKKAKS